MRISLLFSSAAVVASLAACASSPVSVSSAEAPSSAPTTRTATVAEFIGRWDISLFYAEGQAPSRTEMVIESVVDGAMTGTFYGSPFETARARKYGPTLAFTATTKDGTGPYIHSGRLDGDIIEGQTLSVGRAFLMTWRARRVVKPQKQ